MRSKQLILFHLWYRSMKKVIITTHRSKNMSFLLCEFLFNKIIEHKVCWPSDHIQSKAGRVDEPINFLLLKLGRSIWKQSLRDCNVDSFCWLGRKLMLSFIHQVNLLLSNFANFKAIIVCNIPRWCFGTDDVTDQAFRKLREGSCEALCSSHTKMTLQATEGSSPRFSQPELEGFPGFAGPSLSESNGRARRYNSEL